MNRVPQLIRCDVAGPTSVQLKFRDGWAGVLDLAPALHGPIFGELRQPVQFREVTIQDGTLAWPNGADICPDVLRYWCEIGRVCSQKELDAHFTAMYAASSRMVAESPGEYRAKRNSKSSVRK